MSRNLAKLLAREGDDISKDLSKLEEKTGYPSEDVRLMAENKQKVRVKIGQLGLDANDTTDEELFHALRARYMRDSQMLDKALGVDGSTRLADRLNKAIQLVNHCASVDEAWVVKNSVAKATLAKNPPKHVAKQLHFRSGTSMLKREDTAEIFLAGSVMESATWQKNITKHLAKLNASQYELRPIKIVNMKPKQWESVDGPSSHIVIDRHIGAVAVWPSDDLKNASVLCLTLLLLEGIQSLNPNGYSESLPELSPALRWWADSSYLISDGQQPVSLNLKDVSFNHLMNHELHLAIRHHGAHSLWHELTSRYQQVSESLSNKVISLEDGINHSELQPEFPVVSELAAEHVTLE